MRFADFGTPLLKKLIDKNLLLFNEYVSIVQRDCGPWLKATRNLEYQGYHYSGKNFAKSGLTKIKTKTDRKPRDSSSKLHYFMNSMIEEKGLVANRSNSIFVVGGSSNYDYGNYRYSFLPIGKFNFTWSPKYSDWTNDLSDYISDVDYKKYKRDKETYWDKHIKEVKSNIRGDDRTLLEALGSDHEVMIHPVGGEGYMLMDNYSNILQYLLKGNVKKAKHLLFLNLYNDDYKISSKDKK